jgi:hypothetical protein
MAHVLVDQLRFTRGEWLRGLDGISDDDAAKHFGPMNCISWTVGHLAWHEQRYWLELAQGKMLITNLNEIYAYGAPMSTPSLKEMLEIWHMVTKEVDPFLNTQSTKSLLIDLLRDGKSVGQSIGSALRRVTYHYWYHIGEIQAIRQMLGHKNLAEYVGDIETEAPYRPE